MNELTYRHKKVAEAFSLNLKNISPKGWIYGAECPFCGNSDKFGIKFNHERNKYKNHVSFNCFHGQCQERGSEFKLLKAIDMLHLIQDGEFLGKKDRLEQLEIVSKDIELDLSVPTRGKPFGYRRADQNDYLDNRGFESWQYQLYNIGTTKLFDKLKNYVIFLIEEDREIKGYVARLMLNHQDTKTLEAKLGYELMRYKNEAGVDFGKLVHGIDEITEHTKKVILVEGVTDKANVDKQLRLDKQEHTKCCCTFGKKISEEQILKLWKKGLEEIVVLYDPDAVNASKRYAYQLELWFATVKVGYLHDKDPGDLDRAELIDVLDNVKPPSQFDVDKVQKYKLI